MTSEAVGIDSESLQFESYRNIGSKFPILSPADDTMIESKSVHHLSDSNSFSISSIVGKLPRKSFGRACPNS